MQDKPDHRQTQESPAGDPAAPSLPAPLRLSPEELEEIASGDGVNLNCKRLGRIKAFGPPCAWEPGSKVNTWWKDPSNVAQASQFWSRVASEIMGPLEAERENRRTKT